MASSGGSWAHPLAFPCANCSNCCYVLCCAPYAAGQIAREAGILSDLPVADANKQGKEACRIYACLMNLGGDDTLATSGLWANFGGKYRSTLRKKYDVGKTRVCGARVSAYCVHLCCTQQALCQERATILKRYGGKVPTFI